MRYFHFVSLVFLAAQISESAETNAVQITDPREKLSYSLGLNIGANYRRQLIDTNDIDPNLFARGFKDAFLSQAAQVTEKDAQEAARAFGPTVRTRQEERRKQLGEKNKLEGEAFLAANKNKEGVKTLASGLQYKVLQEGVGAIPKSNDTVQVIYRGTFLDGTEFDSSQRIGGPATFPMSNLVKGWVEALQLMKVGSKWQLFIPSNLAYGERGYGQNISPNTTLLFDMELVGITPAPPAPEPVTSDIIKVPSAEELKKGAQIEIIKAPKPGETPAPKPK